MFRPRIWLASLAFLCHMPVAWAHGVQIKVNSAAIEIQATYSNGQPLREAQVQVYSPNDPKQPWLSGTTDRDGHFSFAPDTNQPGNWNVSVRQAGHGGTTSVTVGRPAQPAAVPPSPNQVQPTQPATSPPTQPWVSVGAIVWGCIGTALFFARGKRAGGTH